MLSYRFQIRNNIYVPLPKPMPRFQPLNVWIARHYILVVESTYFNSCSHNSLKYRLIFWKLTIFIILNLREVIKKRFNWRAILPKRELKTNIYIVIKHYPHHYQFANLLKLRVVSQKQVEESWVVALFSRFVWHDKPS